MQARNIFINSIRVINLQYKSKIVKKSNRLSSGPKIITNLFTKREIEIIRLICKQYSNHEIADKLNISVRTIEGYRERINKKAKVTNPVGLVLYAIKHEIFKIRY